MVSDDDPTFALMAEVRGLAERMNAPGWPRPFHEGRPVPWVIGEALLSDGWGAMQPPRITGGYDERLCVVCGEPMEGSVVMGRYFGAATDRKVRRYRITDGPPGHPRCIVLAARYCPHLAREGERTPNDTGIIAYVYDGLHPAFRIPVGGEPGTLYLVNPRAVDVTLEQLRALARERPLG